MSTDFIVVLLQVLCTVVLACETHITEDSLVANILLKPRILVEMLNLKRRKTFPACSMHTIRWKAGTHGRTSMEDI
jgi:hypothetical protein